MVDSHCHLADAGFSEDLEAVVGRARDAGVVTALCVVELGDEAEASRAERVIATWPSIRFAVGLHPHQASTFAGRADRLAEAIDAAWRRRPGACAIGEIGLDYHYDLSPREIQREIFAAQVRVARERRVPIVVHTREADEDTITILEEHGRGEVRGVFHCFSGTPALASAALGLGFALSFSGILTFPRAQGLRETAASVPDDRLLVETDCPYLAPVPHRGRRNEPAWVVETAAALAAARGTDIAVVDRLTTTNFERLFGVATP